LGKISPPKNKIFLEEFLRLIDHGRAKVPLSRFGRAESRKPGKIFAITAIIFASGIAIVVLVCYNRV
jgi:hypothetical protein